ncbi:MAG: carboxypeptidase regulatory-like domain-containing protein [Bryobacterales bacterium]|nr:carboxypeptidase regulatory-like domain-containing protein [Bryobacterales bacterium]
MKPTLAQSQMSGAIALACLVLALVLSAGPTLLAQVTTATLYGIVVDQSEGVIPGAAAELTSEGTGAVYRRESNVNGEFGFTFIPAGSYRLRIEANGFKTLQEVQIGLGAAQNVRRTFQLEVGEVTETIEVTSAIPLVNTVSAEQRENIDTRQISELPLSRRNIAGVVTLGTGVVRNSGDIFLNGSGRGGTQVSVDGTDATSNPERPSINMFGNFNYVSTISIDAVQEVQLIKGVIPAEYTRAMGGNLNLITKSGTNEVHGTLFENFRSEELNARNQRLSGKPGVTFNQFGGSVGGAIVKDRIFAFGVYEGYRERAFSPVSDDVPTQKIRGEMLAAVPAYSLWLDTVPLPNQPHDPDADSAEFLGAGSLQNNENHFVIKPDVRITDNVTATVNWTRGRPEQIRPRVQEINFRRFSGQTDRISANVTAFGSNWTSETRYGYNRNVVDRLDGIFNVKDPDREEQKEGSRRIPCVSALGFGGCGEILTLGAPSWQFDQKFALTKGQHSLKFGVVFFRRGIGRANIENPSIRYQNKEDLLANIPNIAQMTFGTDRYTAVSNQWGMFVQDDWRVAQNLVVNWGFRTDSFGHYTAQGPDGGPPHTYNRGLVDTDFTLSPVRDVNDPYKNDHINLAPRLGFSWNPDGDGTTVVRGGVGVVFTDLAGETVTQTVQNSLNEPFRARLSRAEVIRLGLGYPLYNEDVLPLVSGGLTGGSPRVIDPGIDSGYVYNFYFGLQRVLTDNVVVESAFVGNRGVKWLTSRIGNPVDRFTGIRPNPGFSSFDYWDNSDSTRYLSWQTSLRHRYSRNLSANLHYTWAKQTAYGAGDTGWVGSGTQDFFDLRSNRGLANQDVQHVFVSDIVYDLPEFSGMDNLLAREVLGGWQVSAIYTGQTALPVNLRQPTAISSSRPDYVGGSPTLGNARSTLQYLNPDAFAEVPETTVGAAERVGNLGRNALRGHGLINIDFSLGKNFAIAESARLQFRADFFNVFNHTNLSSLEGNIESSNFGRFRGTRGAREIQLNAKIVF